MERGYPYWKRNFAGMEFTIDTILLYNPFVAIFELITLHMGPSLIHFIHLAAPTNHENLNHHPRSAATANIPSPSPNHPTIVYITPDPPHQPSISSPYHFHQITIRPTWPKTILLLISSHMENSFSHVQHLFPTRASTSDITSPGHFLTIAASM